MLILLASMNFNMYCMLLYIYIFIYIYNVHFFNVDVRTLICCKLYKPRHIHECFSCVQLGKNANEGINDVVQKQVEY